MVKKKEQEDKETTVRFVINREDKRRLDIYCALYNIKQQEALARLLADCFDANPHLKSVWIKQLVLTNN